MLMTSMISIVCMVTMKVHCTATATMSLHSLLHQHPAFIIIFLFYIYKTIVRDARRKVYALACKCISQGFIIFCSFISKTMFLSLSHLQQKDKNYWVLLVVVVCDLILSKFAIAYKSICIKPVYIDSRRNQTNKQTRLVNYKI